MRLGLALPSRPATWAALVALARQAEDLGLASVWLPDPDRQAPDDALDPLVALAGLARVTTTVGLGTMALDAGCRPPGVLAKALATVDRLSGGRLTVGLAPSDDTEAAAAQLAEVLVVLRAALGGQTVHHAGRFHRLEGLRVDPGPVQVRLPLWAVGGSDAVMAVAAGSADGWNPGTWYVNAAEAGGDSARVDDACRRVGRDPATLARSANWLAAGGVGAGAGSGDLSGWAVAGVADLVASPGALPFRGTTTDDLRAMASATE
ncbi:MAG: LLM class flavin-dependent oxidoreductase [Acidimicrobiales bacterium]